MFKRFMLLAVMATTLCLGAQAQKFGYINSSEILNVMPDRITADNTLKTIADKWESELKSLQDEGQKKVSELLPIIQDETQPSSVRERHEKELQDLENRIQTVYQTAQQDMQRQQETLYAPIQQKLQNAIQAVGAEGGYTFIFDQAAGSILYTGANAEDVSAKIKAKLGIQ